MSDTMTYAATLAIAVAVWFASWRMWRGWDVCARSDALDWVAGPYGRAGFNAAACVFGAIGPTLWVGAISLAGLLGVSADSRVFDVILVVTSILMLVSVPISLSLYFFLWPRFCVPPRWRGTGGWFAQRRASKRG